MSINTDYLKTFLTLNQTGSFTLAAEKLGLSQSAISQKIARLEDFLQTGLIIRKTEGLELTASGEKLLNFAKSQVQMEEDFLRQFNQYAESLNGNFRLSAYSSITRSLLIPKLAPLMRKHPEVNIEFSSNEVVHLEKVLKMNQADAVVLDYISMTPGIEQVKIQDEEFVLIKSAKHEHVPEIYLDHGPHDNATEDFFKLQKKSLQYRRGFMGDVYGILDAVALGLGLAVMSKHLVDDDRRFKIIPMPKKYLRPVMLTYYRQSYYSPLHQKIVSTVEE
jgi:DNA-binding transcriptional LysR family regulator